MKLKAQIKILSSYRGNSKYSLFKEFEIGDVIQITSPFEWPKGNRGHTYAQSITLYNPRTGSKFTDSLRGIINRLEQVDYEEIA